MTKQDTIKLGTDPHIKTGDFNYVFVTRSVLTKKSLDTHEVSHTTLFSSG